MATKHDNEEIENDASDLMEGNVIQTTELSKHKPQSEIDQEMSTEHENRNVEKTAADATETNVIVPNEPSKCKQQAEIDQETSNEDDNDGIEKVVTNPDETDATTPTEPPKRKPRSEIDQEKPVTARLLTNRIIYTVQKNIVGYCRYNLHRGKLNVKLLREHKCLEKQCPFFDKYEESPYWDKVARAKEKKAQRKREKAAQKQREREEAAFFEELKILFQSYADEAGYTMQIVRVHGFQAYIYVYYVSENNFADGNRFKRFLKSAHFFFPHHIIRLRQIRDLDGHFLTIEEYAKLKKQ